MTRRRRTWVGLFVVLLLVLLYSAWNSLKFKLISWHKLDPASAAYESVIIGAVVGAVSMVAALAIAVPAILVGVITVVILLAFSGKPLEHLVVEAGKATKEIAGHMGGALLKEGQTVAAVVAVLGYFALVKRSSDY
ncbi:uncharacterized protein LOC116194017 [Punica granatum]|uniref:Uncharacterized protein n=2 Tax=Punica granatum TaxID=22663 RepID=A0A218X0F8_PUNGR|nr:uncharacterized protein LOC116194017 [Punica granatum]OWM78655.1 hypothetical protein CDL15_Pgr002826 [Punica granatum]PKI42704.1 hypothetical protein CRG98_036832 [Punica granatum]